MAPIPCGVNRRQQKQTERERRVCAFRTILFKYFPRTLDGDRISRPARVVNARLSCGLSVPSLIFFFFPLSHFKAPGTSLHVPSDAGATEVAVRTAVDPDTVPTPRRVRHEDHILREERRDQRVRR